MSKDKEPKAPRAPDGFVQFVPAPERGRWVPHVGKTWESIESRTKDVIDLVCEKGHHEHRVRYDRKTSRIVVSCASCRVRIIDIQAKV